MAPGSFSPSMRAALEAAITAIRMKPASSAAETGLETDASSRQKGNPASEPKVPGAKGILPAPNPVARKSTALLDKFMHGLYNLT